MVPGEKAAHPGDEQVLLVPEAAHPEDLLRGAPPDTEPREPEALRQGEAAASLCWWSRMTRYGFWRDLY